MMKNLVIILIFLILAVSPVMGEERKESVCFGTPDAGRLENAWQLPSSGRNFKAYSMAGVTLGRNYVHSKVYKVVVDAYRDCEVKIPATKFVYGETGWKHGGRFRPHKSHRNGLSVDFFVPVTDLTSKSFPLPTGAFNKFGYAIEFNQQGRYGEYSIDFEAMAVHLLSLKNAADRQALRYGG